MYHLTTALIYNASSVKAEQAPKSYQDLLSPAWKGKMLFDPEAGYILAAMEEAWGRERAVDYLTKLSKQDISYRRGGTLTTQVVTSGEYSIGIAINGETSARPLVRIADINSAKNDTSYSFPTERISYQLFD